MRRPDQQHETRDTAHATAWIPVAVALAVMVTGCLSTFFVLQLDTFRPHLGDIVVFRPGSQDADMWEMKVPAKIVSATGKANGTCTMDPNVIATDGGSMVVEGVQEQPTLSYQVHWAGIHTDGAADCGARANLMVSRTDLQRLANAAGGFGVGEKGINR
jgi:hypothetical protein